MPVVVDASATLGWLFAETDSSDWIEAQLRSDTLIVPYLWQLEVVHTVLKKERQHKLAPEQANVFLEILEQLDIEFVAPTKQSLSRLAQFARPHQLSAYDACYLELAIERDAELLTLDNNLRDAARRLGVPLVEMR